MDESNSHGAARALFTASKSGVLSTLSVEVEGFPFGSIVPYCLDRQGRPVILISHIAQHTKNVSADPRVCLTVLAGGNDVQASARLSLLARAASVGEDVDDIAGRYYRHFPASRDYHKAHGFLFARLEPVRFRWIGGFGDIRWIDPQALLLANPFSADEEAAIVGHMNQDHASTMRSYCHRLAGLKVADGEPIVMAGIDAEGCDLLTRDRLVRLVFAEPVATPDEARRQLVALARQSPAS